VTSLAESRAVDLLQIARLRDPHGVLSVYVDADPREQAAVRPAWVVAAENGLDDVRDRVKAEGDRDRWSSLQRRLEALEDDLVAILDPRRPGRGRALFVAVGSGETRHVSMQMPLVDLVALGDVAELTPLFVALERGRPAGLVAVSHTAVRVLEQHLGAVEELRAFEIDPETSDWREMKGPAGANPGLPQHAAPQRDRYERRLDENRARLLEAVAADLGRLCRERGWDRVALAGDPRLTQRLVEELEPNPVDVSLDERTLNGRSATEIADVLAPKLEQASLRREAELVRRATDAALSGNAGALGLHDVLAALQDGRVEHLLFDERVELQGARTADGRLAPEGVVPPGVAREDLVPEPSLIGHVLERALATDARVTPLSAAAAEPLAEHDGIAALLRW